MIDLGSNSFRLVVFMAADGWWKRTDEIYEPVRIGEGLAASGRLGERPMERALATLDVFAHFCRAAGLQNGSVDAVATSAIRDAENAAEFLGSARELIGLPIRVLSREEEARYGYLAAVNSTTLTSGCVLDLGGGSLQLVGVADRLARESGSWRVGTVRMSERFLPPNGPAKRKQLEELREHVARELEQASWLAQTGRRLVGLGGTVRSLATAAQRAAGLPSNGVQGMVIEREALDELVERLAALPAAERSTIPGVKPARADLILAGAIVVQGVLQAGGFDGLEATEAGLREGVFFERLLTEHEPPLFEDLRRTSVMNLAARYNVDAAHTRHVAALALGMFDELAQLGLHHGDARERELLVGGLHAARHRHVRRLRRPPQALALSDPQRRPAGLLADRGRDDRPGRPLSPQGDAGPGAAGSPVRRRGHGAPEPLRRAAAPGRGSRALARSARARR